MQRKLMIGSFGLMMVLSSNAYAQSCQQYTNQGHSANSMEELIALSATRGQVDDFKKVIGDHVSDIATSWFSSKKKALNLVRKSNQLTMYVRESLALTRADCFIYPAKDMEKSAKENFDALLEALIRKQNL